MIFLPVLLLIYCIVPEKARNVILLIASLFFYAFGEPKYVLVMLGSIIFNYVMGLLIHGSKYPKLFLILTVVGNIFVLSLFKYTDFLAVNLNRIPGIRVPMLGLALPIGISFYTFQTMSYCIDVYRGKVKCQKNIIKFALYVTMFPQLIAGPIVQYKTVAAELNSRKITADDFAYGIKRFMLGLSKKVLIANTVGEMFSQISATTTGLTTATAWLGVIAFTLQLYFDFSGYSDMAIGLGRMFGFKFLENFVYPFQSKSITELWQRWHISLGAFFREYLYIPLGGNRKGKARQVLNMFIVWGLTGLWHGASWNFVLWGLFYFVLLLIEKFFLGKYLKKMPPIVANIYAVGLFVIGCAIFAYSDYADGAYYVSALIGKTAFADSNTLYYLANYAAVLIIAMVFSTDYPKRLYKKIIKTDVSDTAFQILFTVVAFALCVAFLVSDSYNPFLYFRF